MTKIFNASFSIQKLGGCRKLGGCLKRFYTLFNSVLDFFQESNPELYNILKSIMTDIAYLAEMFSKFNEMNLQLQGDEISLIKARSVLSAFL